MTLRPAQPADANALAAYWNEFWQGAPRAFPITGADFRRRVFAMPGYTNTTLLIGEGGFVHFGPREPWWFQSEHRGALDPTAGMIYALCAADDSQRAALLAEAEAGLRAAGAETLWLWPTWAQGTVPFYSGLSPSNEISGLWDGSPLAAWGQTRGYRAAIHYRLGILNSLQTVPPPILPPDVELLWEDFPTPLLPGAKRLTLHQRGMEIAHVIAVESVERRRVTGAQEWAAFDVAVTEPYRGQGYGTALMRALAAQVAGEGGDAVQLHMVQGNVPAENLYFRSLGFGPLPEGGFLSLQKTIGKN